MAAATLEDLWADDDDVEAVVVTGAGDRGLCAGGDIVAIYRDMLDGGDATADFWADEYRLNLLIAEFPKPYVAFMDGLVLGGGVGMSAHGSVRVVTERTRTGMPETTIGFLPDVGGTLLLSRSPGEPGTHAALTGAHLTARTRSSWASPTTSCPPAACRNWRRRSKPNRWRPPSHGSPNRLRVGLAGQREWIDACYSATTPRTSCTGWPWRRAGREAAGAADTVRPSRRPR